VARDALCIPALQALESHHVRLCFLLGQRQNCAGSRTCLVKITDRVHSRIRPKGVQRTMKVVIFLFCNREDRWLLVLHGLPGRKGLQRHPMTIQNSKTAKWQSKTKAKATSLTGVDGHAQGHGHPCAFELLRVPTIIAPANSELPSLARVEGPGW
jgi:hypothetical protein